MSQPTSKETEFLAIMAKHTRNKPDVDWAGFAAEAGFKSAGVASTRYRQIRRKLGWNSAAEPSGSSPRGKVTTADAPNGAKESNGSPNKPNKVTKRARKNAAVKSRKLKKDESEEEVDKDEAMKDEIGSSDIEGGTKHETAGEEKDLNFFDAEEDEDEYV